MLMRSLFALALTIPLFAASTGSAVTLNVVGGAGNTCGARPHRGFGPIAVSCDDVRREQMPNMAGTGVSE